MSGRGEPEKNQRTEKTGALKMLAKGFPHEIWFGFLTAMFEWQNRIRNMFSPIEYHDFDRSGRCRYIKIP